MGTTLDQDKYGIIEAMTKNGSFVDGQHIVYKAFANHGRRYLNKDEHLQKPGVAEQVSGLLAHGIQKGSIIIAPETSAEINLGKMVASLTGSTMKVKDIHTFEEHVLPLLKSGGKIIGIDDISNNLRTLREIMEALRTLGLSLDEFRVMADRNPEQSSGITDLQFIALATIQMEQWDESQVPDDLKDQAITTKLGNARRWVGAMTPEMFKQRMHKEELGFHFDDDQQVNEVHTDTYILVSRNA